MGVERCDSCQYIEGSFDSYWESVSLRRYISTSLSFSKLLPENPRIHADSRNSKEIQGFVNTSDFLVIS